MSGPGLFWVASYPKSGNTWIRALIASLERQGADPELNALHRQCPWSARRHWLEDVTQVPTSDLTPRELAGLRLAAHHALAAGGPIARLAAPNVRCIKVHDRYDPERYPASLTAGAVYLIRDPRDVAPSLADHMNISLDDAITQMACGANALAASISRFLPLTTERLGSWTDHAASWIDTYPGSRLLMRYEDLSSDPIREVTRLSAFLGLATTAAMVEAAVMACHLDTLRETERRGGFVERQAHQNSFFRRGRVGGWQDRLSRNQAERITSDHTTMMRRFGYNADGF